VEERNDNKSSGSQNAAGLPSDWLAILPKKVAAAVKDIPLAELGRKMPDELARYLEKIRQKVGVDLEADISKAFSHLKNHSADEFQEGSIAKMRAQDGDMEAAILHDNPTFAATVPVALDRFNTHKSELIGSGVMIRICNRTFLLTAAHVADFKSEGAIMIPGRDGFMSPGGYYHTMNLPASGNRDDDKLDVAYVCLDNDCADNLHSDCRILGHQDLSLEIEPIRRGVYTFAGFPWRKGKVKDGAIETDFSTMSGSEVQKSEYEALGLNRTHHIVIRFNRERSFSERYKRVVVSPLPSGMSGGGVYAWSEEALKARPVRLPLFGIANEFVPDKDLLVATRLHVYIRCILHSYPELFTIVREG
jgi:hypothetical protein